MAEPLSRSWTWRFDSPPEAVWPLLADTARFNEAAGLPKHEVEEQPRPDGSVLYLGRGRMGPFRLAWRERPVNWVTNQWFEHCREFRGGPLALLCARFQLAPDGAGGSRGEYRIEAAPANLLGRLILTTRFFDRIGRDFAALAETARRCARGERETPFDYRAPEPSPELRARVAALVERIEQSGHGHGLASRLAGHLLAAQEVDLAQVRPLRLARHWGVAARPVIELCLEAARAGLLELRWDLLCPRCRVAKATVGALDQLPSGAHCGTCNIDYGRDFSRNVELSFRPAPAVRPISFGEYCLFGPMSTPHIHLHLTLAPGERREVAAALAPGPYRLRTLEPGPQLDIEVEGEGFPEVVAEEDAMAAGPPGAPGQLTLSNRSGRALTLIVEERHWLRDALTADRVTALQAFRDLFSDQVLRPGDEVAVARVALMFTDLSGSTALYGRVGDAAAYHLVRDHFAFLAGVVRAHEGAVVKTIGDAIMAAFAQPADALGAALEVQREVAGFNESHPETPIVLKLGLHEGACIAVTLNDRLDYFGSTVNLAARLQQQSRGGDIVLSGELAQDPAVAALLRDLEAVEDLAALKGFDRPVPFLRVTP
jgi:class 3 adenylate cyclase